MFNVIYQTYFLKTKKHQKTLKLFVCICSYDLKMRNYQHYLEYLTQTEGFGLSKQQMNVLNENYTQSLYGVEFIYYILFLHHKNTTKMQRSCCVIIAIYKKITHGMKNPALNIYKKNRIKNYHW